MWVKPVTKNEHDVPFAGKIKSSDKDRFLVHDDDGKECWISKNQVFHYRSNISTWVLMKNFLDPQIHSLNVIRDGRRYDFNV